MTDTKVLAERIKETTAVLEKIEAAQEQDSKVRFTMFYPNGQSVSMPLDFRETYLRAMHAVLTQHRTLDVLELAQQTVPQDRPQEEGVTIVVSATKMLSSGEEGSK